ncbi:MULTISPECIES: hypothetical protein [Paenarthrobacter]|uniref:hypothetical protein n=1 Tax=Paenarthrobacter TaxID=1742992 RepID=UPI002230DC86|nr:hypothetical protein [Paenarthrobacter sp. PAE-2]MCW3767263.1 hypothetical protein [Paenarthrobacter sp. PAE-2]
MTEPRDFQQEVLAALNGSSPHNIVSGVKTAVAEKLAELDERVDVVFTEYFNHSYMPDMFLTWQEAGRRVERPLFVRTDVDPLGIAADIHGLIAQSPLVIGVDERSSGAPAREAVREEQKTRRVDLLMTDTGSISALSPTTMSPKTGYDFSKLISQNFLRGGRGYVGKEEASSIYSASVLTDHAESFDAFNSAVDQFFMEDAALRLKRSTGLVRDVLRGEFGELSLAGQFTQAELRTVLPLLLGNPEARRTRHLWDEIGEVMTLSDLFEIAADLEAYDVSPLLDANVNRWSAKRSQVVMNMVTPEEDAHASLNEAGTASSSREAQWKLWRGLIALDIEDWRILFADDARKLKGRFSGGGTPQWSDLADKLPSFRVKAVDLHGLSRRVSISAEQSGDIYSDISSVTDALEESFYVPRIQIQDSIAGVDTTSLVEFSEMLVTSSPSDSLANHARAALNLLLHNRQIDTSSLGNALAEAINRELSSSSTGFDEEHVEDAEENSGPPIWGL